MHLEDFVVQTINETSIRQRRGGGGWDLPSTLQMYKRISDPRLRPSKEIYTFHRAYIDILSLGSHLKSSMAFVVADGVRRE